MSCKINAFIAAVLLSVIHLKSVPPPQILEKQMVKRIIVPQQAGGIPASPGPIAIPSGRRTNNRGEHVQLLNGDLFRGKFMGYDPTKGMRWKHPHVDSDLLIATQSVATLAFDVTSPPENSKQHACKIELVNGDKLSGELVRMESGKLILNTWYSGELTINQAAITSIVPGYTNDKVYFNGPSDTKNWVQTNGTWKLKNRSFTTASAGSMLGRNIDNTPKRAAINFEIDWASSLNLYVNFRTDKLNSYTACNGYCLRLTQSYVYLYRYTFNNGAGRGKRLGTSSIRINLNGANRNARVSIKVDEKNSLVVLYINGKFISKWVDTSGFAGKGNGLLFSSRTTNRIQLSQIRVSEWNGDLVGQNKTVAGNNKGDFVLFTNDDSISGNLMSIKEGQMKIKTSFGELPIPLEKVDAIYMAKEGRWTEPTINPLIKSKTTPFVRPPLVQASLFGRSSMTFSIEEWKDGKVTVQSPFFGKAVVNAAAIQSAVFNLGTSRTTSSSNMKPTLPMRPIPNFRQNIDPLRNIRKPLPKIRPR